MHKVDQTMVRSSLELLQFVINSTTAIKIKAFNIKAAVNWCNIGMSPKKTGCTGTIPAQFANALLTWVTMMQGTAGQGKASRQKR